VSFISGHPTAIPAKPIPLIHNNKSGKAISFLNHFSHSELACPTTGQVRLAAGFGEATWYRVAAAYEAETRFFENAPSLHF
jgi:hypothetical protein